MMNIVRMTRIECSIQRPIWWNANRTSPCLAFLWEIRQPHTIILPPSLEPLNWLHTVPNDAYYPFFLVPHF